MSSHVIHARPARGDSGPIRVETAADRLAGHLEDAAHVPGGHAAGLAMPRDEADVSALLRQSRAVLAVGAQSSLTGGATPMGEIVLSTARLRSISIGEGTVTAGAGVPLVELEAALEAVGAWYPPVPTFTGATVGGVVATNAAGAATFKYGATRPWVEALTVVLANGEVLDLRRGTVLADARGGFDIVTAGRTIRVDVPGYRLPDVPKVSAGYFAAPGMDLIDLFIGAEGTLGIVTEVTFRIVRGRPETALLLVFCPDRGGALRLVADVREAARRTWRDRDPHGIDVSAIEHMDGRCLELLREDGVDRELAVPVPEGAALALLITLELPGGMDDAAAYDAVAGAEDGTAPDSGLTRLCGLLAAAGLLDHTALATASERTRRGHWLAFREAVPVGVNRRVGEARWTVDARIEKLAADVIVPYARLEAVLDVWDRELADRGLDGAVWGHISDGNLHPNVIPRSVAEFEAGRAAILAVGRAAIALGGAPCAEHGVGRNRIKQQLLRELYGDEGIEAMRAVKRALDPERKLAPGVLGL